MSIWSSRDIEWAKLDAEGSSGGLFVLWDTSKVEAKETLKGVLSLSILFSFSNSKEFWITNVYGPSDYKERRNFWLELHDISSYCDKLWCIGADFNMVRWPSEHSSGRRLSKGMKKFSPVIVHLDLIELPLSNGKFTWSKMGNDSTHSLLDRFLISRDWDAMLINSKVSCAVQPTSYHFPIILEAGGFIWGPYPFRFYNSWLLDKDCIKLIEEKLAADKSYDWLVMLSPWSGEI